MGINRLQYKRIPFVFPAGNEPIDLADSMQLVKKRLIHAGVMKGQCSVLSCRKLSCNYAGLTSCSWHSLKLLDRRLT
jgi:hypothetical protein